MKRWSNLGSIGESLAVAFLKEKSYEILATNWRFKKAEVDIIAKLAEKIIFIEVKTRSSKNMGEPTEFVTKRKEDFMFRCANEYMIKIDFQGEIRFDFISIIYQNQSRYKLQHFEDAFFP